MSLVSPVNVTSKLQVTRESIVESEPEQIRGIDNLKVKFSTQRVDMTKLQEISRGIKSRLQNPELIRSSIVDDVKTGSIYVYTGSNIYGARGVLSDVLKELHDICNARRYECLTLERLRICEFEAKSLLLEYLCKDLIHICSTSTCKHRPDELYLSAYEYFSYIQ